MVDLEGPSNPADKNGCKYTMTYICCLCHGILLESSPRITAADVRRMFANCIMRSGTVPTLLRSDRGPELKNILMAEYSSMLGLGRRFGTPWRPMEQGLVESRHLETQKVMGMLVKDIMQCFPNETGELLHVWSLSCTIRLVLMVIHPETSIVGGLWRHLLTRSSNLFL